MLLERKIGKLNICSKSNKVSKYVIKNEIDTTCGLIEEQRHIEIMIKSLQEEKAIADKVLEGAV